MDPESKDAEAVLEFEGGMPHKDDLRIATIGNVDAGKSSLVGVLISNAADDG
jgi:GTPase